MIPTTFEEWTNCIVNDCGISLTPEYAKERAAILNDKTNTETKKFITIYGEEHHAAILAWFERIAAQAS